MIYFLVNDTLDDMLTESGDEEESDNIVTQVLDEIGIEISGKVCIDATSNLLHILNITNKIQLIQIKTPTIFLQFENTN